MFIQLICKETTENMLESKFVKYMSYEPDLLTIKSSLMKYIDLIKNLSELLDKVDSNELKLRESKPQKLIVLFETEDDFKNMITYPWFKTAYDQLSKIVEISINDLIENILKYKEFDEILNIKENDTYQFFKNFKDYIKVEVEEGKEDQLSKDQQQRMIIKRSSLHSNQNIESKSRQGSSSRGGGDKIKRKKSKSDFEREKRELEKLHWRDDNLDNPSSI